MLFFSGSFLLFAVAVFALSALLAGSVRARTVLLLVASYVFYAAWDWRFCLLILASTAVDFVVARRLPRSGHRGLLLVASLVMNLGALAVFKYLDFGIGSLNALLGTEWGLVGLTLPVGISFFTFQSMSYTIDVYRGRLQPDTDFLTFALFVSFFPQLVAGPIIRASAFLPQVQTALRRPLHDLTAAAPLFVFGLFKKVVVADQLGIVLDPVFADPAAFCSIDRWTATLAFAGQIYCDFSGYTDMALALCMAMGFSFPRNFESPYLACGPRAFWRRWHISLSTWLRDYLYVPLGGNRKGPGRLYLALFATMALGGLWHGAKWTFVIWGMFHGLLLIVERLMGERGPPAWLRWPFFFALTLLGWMIFRADSLEVLRAMLDGIWLLEGGSQIAWPLVLAGAGWVVVDHLFGEWNRRSDLAERRPTLAFAAAGVLLPLCFVLRPDHSVPFIYFQF